MLMYRTAPRINPTSSNVNSFFTQTVYMSSKKTNTAMISNLFNIGNKAIFAVDGTNNSHNNTAATMDGNEKKAICRMRVSSINPIDRKSTRLNSSHVSTSYAV